MPFLLQQCRNVKLGAIALLFLGSCQSLVFAESTTLPATASKSQMPPQAAEVGESAYVGYVPYVGGKELDLWRLEAVKFIRSEPVISPNQQAFAYTEVMYMPHTRQTISKLFLVPLTPLDPLPETLPSEQVSSPAKSADYYQSRLDPDKTLKIRQQLLGVGDDRSVKFEFRTLTIVDWSASGKRLLFKQRSGMLHVGLKTSDLLVYDQTKGTVTIYPEIQRILQHHWQENSNLPNLDTVAWDIYPLGWAMGSDNLVIFRAWAFDKKQKKFLGLWQYDVDAQRASLISENDTPYQVAGNGLVPNFLTPPPNATPPRQKLKQNVRKLRFWEK